MKLLSNTAGQTDWRYLTEKFTGWSDFKLSRSRLYLQPMPFDKAFKFKQYGSELDKCAIYVMHEVAGSYITSYNPYTKEYKCITNGTGHRLFVRILSRPRNPDRLTVEVVGIQMYRPTDVQKVIGVDVPKTMDIAKEMLFPLGLENSREWAYVFYQTKPLHSMRYFRKFRKQKFRLKLQR